MSPVPRLQGHFAAHGEHKAAVTARTRPVPRAWAHHCHMGPSWRAAAGLQFLMGQKVGSRSRGHGKKKKPPAKFNSSFSRSFSRCRGALSFPSSIRINFRSHKQKILPSLKIHQEKDFGIFHKKAWETRALLTPFAADKHCPQGHLEHIAIGTEDRRWSCTDWAAPR